MPCRSAGLARSGCSYSFLAQVPRLWVEGGRQSGASCPLRHPQEAAELRPCPELPGPDAGLRPLSRAWQSASFSPPWGVWAAPGPWGSDGRAACTLGRLPWPPGGSEAPRARRKPLHVSGSTRALCRAACLRASGHWQLSAPVLPLRYFCGTSSRKPVSPAS